jgi:radical SAM superfamily enzyme YgiQ (UPF0313 family)
MTSPAPCRVKLINPRWPEGSLQERLRLKFPVLGIYTLASLFPAGEHGWEVTVTDEAVELLDFDDDVDLVCITTLTPLAPRAYAIADEYRQRGVPVLLGGIHASALPDEALQHADAVVVGEAEGVLPEVLEEFRQGRMKGIYRHSELVDLRTVPPLRQELVENKSYFMKNLLQTTRGCPHDCEFCTVTAYYGNSFRRRPIETLRLELQAFSRSYLFVVDDNIIGHRSHAFEVFSLLKEFNIRWWGQSSLTIASRPDLLRACADSGCLGLFLGFESLDQQLLNDSSKRFNRVEQYLEVASKIHDAGLGVQGSFIFGLDGEGEGCFDRFLEFAMAAQLDAVLCGILTPFPGTRLAQRMDQQGRILHHDWEQFDTQHVVFRPQGMTAEALQEGYRRTMLEVHSEDNVRKRLAGSSNFTYYLSQNISFGRAIREAFGNGEG